VLADYAALEAHQRNVLRMMFLEPRVRERQLDWESVARFVVASFRAETTRVGATEAVKALVDELSRASPDFVRLWRDNDVRAHGGGVKTMRDPTGAMLSMEYSAFAVDGRPDLAMVIYNPATPEDAERIRALIEAREW
jgi:hypothetical protein